MIAADPARELGAACAARFGGRLPFLLKVLAADKALSIQVHPSREQAEAGYREETARGLAPSDTSRHYVDDWPKPQILCALSRFVVMVGLRSWQTPPRCSAPAGARANLLVADPAGSDWLARLARRLTGALGAI